MHICPIFRMMKTDHRRNPRPGTQPGCVHDRSGDETLHWCDRPVAKTVTAKLCDKPADNLETMCVNNNDIMNSVSDDRDLDIANMSDFSDDEAGSQPRTQTGCVLDSSFNETLSWCDRPVANTVTARDDRDLLDPNDRGILDQIPPPHETGIFVG